MLPNINPTSYAAKTLLQAARERAIMHAKVAVRDALLVEEQLDAETTLMEIGVCMQVQQQLAADGFGAIYTDDEMDDALLDLARNAVRVVYNDLTRVIKQVLR